MNPIQIVFLFDLNAYSDVRPRSGPALHQKLLCLRLSCLRILTHYSTAVPNLKWGFKFFDSRGKITQIMCKFSFTTVSLESYETLENEISVQYQRHASYLEALAVPSEQNTAPSNNESVCSQDKKMTTPVQLLQLALNEILCEFQWESSLDAFSPCVTSRNFRKREKRNLLFLITRCATSNDEFQEFFGSDNASVTSVKLTKMLLSQSLQEQLLEKGSILWIWLNTSENQNTFKQYKPEILKLLCDALKSLGCALIPLSVLSQPTEILRFEKDVVGYISQIYKLGEVYNSIVPFSTLFLQSISYPFYMKDSGELYNESTICFLQKDVHIPVMVNKLPFKWKREENNLLFQTVTSADETGSDAVSKLWNKFTVHFAVSKHTRVIASDVFLCLPSVSEDMSCCEKMQDLIKSLFSDNINLFLVCESVCGTVRPGIFTPLSDTSAVISILDRKACFFLTEKNCSVKTDEQYRIMSSLEIRKKIETNIQSLTINLNDKIEFQEDVNTVSNNILKPFQMECLESWFEPTSSTSSILSESQHHSSFEGVDAFHSKLFKCAKKKDLEEDPSKSTESIETVEEEVTDELCKDITYDQLIAMLTEIYNSALDFNGRILFSAKKILKLASSFFLQKSIISYEESMKNFMDEFFCTTSRKLSEKYDMNQDLDATTKKINECQMQAFLSLEMEILFPSVDSSNCVNTVISFLRTMSFFSGATELNKFLCEVLKANYSHNLYAILVEIGDELDIPFNPEDDSLDDPSESLSFTSVADIFDSAFSTLSVKSSSSTASTKSDNRRLQRKRSDISDTRKSRQVLLPTKSPKAKKTKAVGSGTEGIAIRFSPRLASKKKKEKFKTMDGKPETVRRNLFPRDKKPQTPRTSKNLFSSLKKKRSQTPKGHHVLKTNFVADTPAHKQKHSALQRRISQVNFSPSGPTVKEIAESPSIAKKARDASNLILLQKLKEKFSKSTLPSTSTTKSVPSCSYHSQHTPESKRRLSLKLFSKLLTSPTARMGLKKCSKRLFDQVSPQVHTDSKRIKLSQEIQNPIESPK